MLPSTGYFHGINCPFYESGQCDRPYCHFRHVKREIQNTANESIESGTILQKLVTAAVQKVLQQKEASEAATNVQNKLIDTEADINKLLQTTVTNKVTYNPTPIAELNKVNSASVETNNGINEQRKRHIPVPYTPRKPVSIPLLRPVDTNGSKPFVYIPPPVKYTPGSTETVQNDTYTPAGSIDLKEKYQPGIEKELPEYSPEDQHFQDASSKRNYVPSSDISVTKKKKVLEYKPIKVSQVGKPYVTYEPTPRSLAPCFSSDEEEPETKKIRLSSDLHNLDDLGPEFDILDQILDEENLEKIEIGKSAPDVAKSPHKHTSAAEKSNNTDTLKCHKVPSSKEISVKEKLNQSETSSDHKEVSQLKKTDSKQKPHGTETSHLKEVPQPKHTSKEEKSNHTESTSNSDKDLEKNHNKHHKKSDKKDHSNKKEKKDKHKDSTTKSSHKSSSSDKDKHSNDKKKHKSKRSHSPRHSKHNTSKKSDKSSHSKSSKKDSRTREKSKDKCHKSSRNDKDKNKSKEKDKNVSHDEYSAEENGHDEDDFELSDPDEDTIALECRKIFEEYVPQTKQIQEEPGSPSRADNEPEEEYVPGKKRVSRTLDKNIKVIPRAPVKPDFKLNAAQAMAERLAKVREFHNSKQLAPAANENSSSKIEQPKSVPAAGGSTKIRIAHVPYASTLLNAKKCVPPSQGPGRLAPSTSSTISQTIKKGEQRVAHIPNEKFIDRPGVLEPLGSKIAANIRSIYLNMMIDECLKLYVTATDAYARAQHEELNTSKKCSTVQIYKNSAVLAVSRLRKEIQECNGIKKSGSVSSESGGSSGNTKNTTGSWSIVSKNRNVIDNSKEFVGAKFFNNIKKWILTEEQLQSNGFPRPHSSGEKGRAIIYGQNKQKPPKGFIRTCCRCKKDYTVNKKGFAAIKQECIYHPNNKYRVRGEARYQCCSQDATSDGCCVAPSHVYEYVDFDNLKGYVTTLPPERVLDDYGVYSLDCEMCYTTHGLDLTRITVINSSCKVVYETLIKPLHPIIDYNTRYSGITEEQMASVTTTLLEVQATLLAMFSSHTILVGHSLESDFKALKLIHDTVIDTSVLFPHKMGPPYKRALRNLCSEHLKKIIQNSVDGHDSAEDATVCMELLHYKLREDLKTR